ncbi:MAG: hypothetical protein U9Q67_00585, partial [Patescibacteria group bacterium]|nr:hypothetical protein [Patescibacteria group bacterium]
MIVPRILSVKYSQGQDFTVSFEGEALNMVKSSDVVKPSTVIFEGDMSEVLQSINLCRELSVLPDKAKSLLLVSDGEIVDKGSVIARRTISMGIAERVIKSEIDGRLCLDRLDSGIVDIMSPFTRSSVTAGVNGRVKSVFHGDGMEQKVVITIDGYVSSAFMILGESISGNICLIKNGDSVYLPADVTSECKGKIVVAGMFLTLKLYDALVVAGAKGIIVGGLSHGVFESIKESAVPVFVTEGWGTIPINSVFLELLCKENGSPAEID